MKRTLQDQYLLIKEGKGHKDVFMKEAKTQFPGLIRNAATFNEIATVLKDKNIINENIVGLEPINQLPGTKKESFETAFENFLKEAKKKEVEDEKAEVKKTSKQVEEDLSKMYDKEDNKNPDNLIFDQIIKGYYTEMKDPKNADKTMEELKAIVLKNLEKNPIYYTENGQFGVKDLGYTTEAPGLGTPKEPKGKYKSSGYGDLNEVKDTLKRALELYRSGLKEQDVKTKMTDFGPIDVPNTKKYIKRDITDVKPGDIIIHDETDKKYKVKRIIPAVSYPGYNSGTELAVVDSEGNERVVSPHTYSILDNGSLNEGIKRNYPNFIDSEYQGEIIPMTGDELYTFLVDTMAISRGEDDFIRKVTYGLTDGTSSLSPEDRQKLRTWYQENSGEKIKTDLGRGFVKESLEEQKLRKVIRESIEKELAAINKEAELEVLDSKLEKIEAAIEKRNAQLSKLDEDEDMKALTDKKKIKSLEKDIKTLEKAKAKIEKQLSKVAKKSKGAEKKQVIDEDEPVMEAEGDVEDAKTTADELERAATAAKEISDTELFEENYGAAEDMYDELIAQGYSNDEAAKEVAGDDEDLYNHLVGYSPDMDSDY